MANLIDEGVRKILNKISFLDIGSSSQDAIPNVAPKLLLKVDGDEIYLVDYIMGKTYDNLQSNCRVSLSAIDVDSLLGYQINGKAYIVDGGLDYQKLFQEYQEKQIQSSVSRIIDGVRREKLNQNIEMIFPEKVVFIKVFVEEIVEIIPSGQLKRRHK